MRERVYVTIDKAGWPRGPWDDEPDKVQFVDEATGLPCLIKRNPRMGFLCGYVGVAEGHPYFGRDYQDVDLDVHDGITYASLCEDGDEATSICHIPEPGEPDHVYWFGFACGRFNDYAPGLVAGYLAMQKVGVNRVGLLSDAPTPAQYWTIDHVRGECARLAAQLKGME